MRNITEITTVSPITAGKAFSVEVPIGPTHLAIQMLLANLTAVQVTDIKLKMNNKIVQEYDDLAELDARNAHYKRHKPSNGSIWYFERPELVEMYRRYTSLRTQGLETLTITGKIVSGVTSPDIEFWSENDPNAEPVGAVLKVRKLEASYSTSGRHTIPKIPRNGIIQAIFFKKADVNHVSLKATNKAGSVEQPIDAKKSVLQEFQKQFRAPNSGETCIDFLKSGNPYDALAGTELQGLEATVDLGTSGNCNISIETVDSLIGV